LTPDVELADLPQKKLVEVGLEDAPDKANDTPHQKKEGGSDGVEEPPHLKDIELAHVSIHDPNEVHGGMKVVSVSDDDEEMNVRREPLPFIDNTDSMPTDKRSNLKTISVAL
jgi:hypothetical protein